MGEKIAKCLGITSSRYQYYVDEAQWEEEEVCIMGNGDRESCVCVCVCVLCLTGWNHVHRSKNGSRP